VFIFVIKTIILTQQTKRHNNPRNKGICLAGRKCLHLGHAGAGIAGMVFIRWRFVIHNYISFLYF